ncbi:50S ribosomal protein L24 [Chloracidobacterium sp. D]|uniref:50S ribosomal protein L24 n=1 Tax=Chloracidobacterium sp. D TaxID=2821536 RepID=UPI001B8B6AAE|nr:50S ribosomal protein L24 [Chloracidobacterium sp. D]QUV81043.1 50S ribosomal protein L24 [Chloracidobacterium sp. D]
MKSNKLSKNLRVGDSVILISGKDKRKIGLVKKIDRSNLRLLVEGISMSKKHIKKTSQNNGGIIEEETWLSFSKVKKK